MQFAILYWFYKDPEVCLNHLQILRKNNPDTPIYGLFGGSPSESDIFRDKLSGYLDDFYVFTKKWNARQKWYFGDLMIATWYRDRGHRLRWDSLVIVQWDMLVLASLETLFPMLRRGQILFSGLRPVSEVEAWWGWVSPANAEQRKIYLAFLEHLRQRYNYRMEPMCCLFVVACLPKEFLQKFVEIENPQLGFLEYKLPMYSQVFGIPFCTEHKFLPWWSREPGSENQQDRQILNAVNLEVTESVVRQHLADPNGVRVFHPFRRTIQLS